MSIKLTNFVGFSFTYLVSCTHYSYLRGFKLPQSGLSTTSISFTSISNSFDISCNEFLFILQLCSIYNLEWSWIKIKVLFFLLPTYLSKSLPSCNSQDSMMKVVGKKLLLIDIAHCLNNLAFSVQLDHMDSKTLFPEANTFPFCKNTLLEIEPSRVVKN